MPVPVHGWVPLALICALPAVALAQAPASTGERAVPPGRLVDVGGRSMHLHCTGSGSPTVIFEPSFGQFGLDWSLVQPDVAKVARACSYDRAGLGWSAPGPNDEHPEQIVADLHALLAAAGEQPPYVFVTMSMGAFYARAYHAAHPGVVSGMVFIEPVHEASFLVPIDGRPTPMAGLSAAQAVQAVESMYKGPRPPPPPLSTGPPFDRLPRDLLDIRIGFEKAAFARGEASSLAGQIAAFESRRVTAIRLASPAGRLGSIPVVVLTAAKRPGPLPVEAHVKIAALSTNAAHRTVAGGHMLHLENPSGVVAAVSDVIVGARTKAPLRP